MNLETLQYFQYIAKYKNITRAAKHFYISQSTLSRYIMALEEELDVKLFIRNNKQIELTEAGKVFESECDLFIKHMETVIKNVQLADKGNSGILRITAPGKLCPVLSDALTIFREKYPFIKLTVELYEFNEIPCAIQYDIYNIGFTYDFAASGYEELESISIGNDDFSLAVSSELYKNPTVETIPEIVRKLPLILPSYIEPPFMKLILHELQTFAGSKKININYVNTTDSVMLEASLGLGYGIVPTSLTKAKSGFHNISYINLVNFSANGNIVMLYKKSATTELVNKFIDIVKSLCPKQPPLSV
ncbi:MAG TPA: LysR family transcriptional regulator [Clostridiales bacterium]|nr:LysR family transcriptional regulator [Clostridiales bacterium]